MSEDDFKLVRAIGLWESSDHWTIQMSKKDDPMNCKFAVRLDSRHVKVLCRVFGIPYDPHWEYGMGQIVIKKAKEQGL